MDQALLVSHVHHDINSNASAPKTLDFCISVSLDWLVCYVMPVTTTTFHECWIYARSKGQQGETWHCMYTCAVLASFNWMTLQIFAAMTLDSTLTTCRTGVCFLSCQTIASRQRSR